MVYKENKFAMLVPVVPVKFVLLTRCHRNEKTVRRGLPLLKNVKIEDSWYVHYQNGTAKIAL